jgi:hypothetical protein
VAKVVAIDSPASIAATRFGFLAGHVTVPADFDRMGEREIARLFGARKK